jgi:hypothetical protein
MLQIHKHQEKDRLIVQLGTSDGQRALNAARLVEKDLSFIRFICIYLGRNGLSLT